MPTLNNTGMVSGPKEIVWDRRTDSGQQVPPASHRHEITAVRAYRDEPVISQTQFTLPMYYHEDCGSVNTADDVHLVRGSSVRWGTAPSQTAEQDPSSVLYWFAGPNTAGDYGVAAESIANDNVARLQDITINSVSLHDLAAVSTTPRRVEYIKLPKAAFEGGEVTISINACGEGSATVSQLWARETGKWFNAQQIEGLIPSVSRLDQNYPNPFNARTTIRYAIPNNGPVTRKAYDVTGREDATRVNEQKNAGTYEVRFDTKNSSGRSLASGVYF